MKILSTFQRPALKKERRGNPLTLTGKRSFYLTNDTNILIQTSIAPWLTVSNAETAATFYKKAFEAIETYRMESPDGGLVLKVNIGNTELWLSSEATGDDKKHSAPIGAGTIRMILTVADPDAVYNKAINAGAIEIFPVGEDYGWRLGRVEDPFGLHWEIGHQLKS